MRNDTAPAARTAAANDVLMGDTVIVQGHAHTVTDEPTYVVSRGLQMVRWALTPAAGSTGRPLGAFDVFPTAIYNVVG